MHEVQAYVNSRRNETLEELLELLRIPSVSASSSDGAAVRSCAELLVRRMDRAGLRAEVLETGGNPVAYGERLAHAGAPTVLVYGHYDVQPPDPIEAWSHAPFEPTLVDGNILARGASDDKGPCYSLLKGVEAFFATRASPGVNVKFLIEGEEEIGSPRLPAFLQTHRERLRTDAVAIADTGQFALGLPSITYGLRGLVCLEVTVRAASRDLHSGSYGGAVANPASVLARLLSSCHGPFGRVAVPGFYDGVRALEPGEREDFARLPFDEEAFRAEVGAPALVGEEGFTTLERRWARPTLEVNGIASGYSGEGVKTVLPSVARAKISARLVPDQEPEKVASLIRGHLLDLVPRGVEVEVKVHPGGRPVLVPREGRAVRAAEKALALAFGRPPVLVREGGSIPIVADFREVLKADCVLLGLALPDDRAHAPDERFRLEDYYRGMVAMASFLEEFAGKPR